MKGLDYQRSSHRGVAACQPEHRCKAATPCISRREQRQVAALVAESARSARPDGERHRGIHQARRHRPVVFRGRPAADVHQRPAVAARQAQSQLAPAAAVEGTMITALFRPIVRRCGAVVLLALLGAAAPAYAQSSLSELNIEDLMRLDSGQVFGASERLQPVTEAPSSVSFVTAEDIKRHGYRTLAEILRGVRGLYVTDDRNFSLIGARGFGKPGDYNSRILLLINGHRVNDNVFGQAEIGAEFGLDPAVFERVEIIRGPASSQYGDSAFFAVINVITKTGASLNGGAATVEVGTLGSRTTRATAGGASRTASIWRWRPPTTTPTATSGCTFRSSTRQSTNNGIAEDLDAERVKQFYSRLSFNQVTVTAAYGTRMRRGADRIVRVDLQLSGDARADDRSPYVARCRVHPNDQGCEGGVPGVVRPVHLRRLLPVGRRRRVRPVLLAHNEVDGSRWTASGRVTRALPGRQVLTAGAEFIDNLRQDQGTVYLDAVDRRRACSCCSTRRARRDRPRSTCRMKYGWPGAVILNAGLRYDRYEQFSRVTPRAALIVMPSANQSFKYLFGNAFRAPNAYERTTVYFGESVERLEPETIDTHEVVWERYFNDTLRTSVSAYWYKADRLLTLVADETTVLGGYINAGKVHAAGVEFEGQLRIRRQRAGSLQLRAPAHGRSGDARRAAEFAPPHGERPSERSRSLRGIDRRRRRPVHEQPSHAARLAARCEWNRQPDADAAARSCVRGDGECPKPVRRHLCRPGVRVCTCRTPSRRTAGRPASDSPGSSGSGSRRRCHHSIPASHLIRPLPPVAFDGSASGAFDRCQPGRADTSKVWSSTTIPRSCRPAMRCAIRCIATSGNSCRRSDYPDQLETDAFDRSVHSHGRGQPSRRAGRHIAAGAPDRPTACPRSITARSTTGPMSCGTSTAA